MAILDDDILEEVEIKLLRLSLAMGGRYVQFEPPSTTYITIIDDDGKFYIIVMAYIIVEEPSPIISRD